MELTEVEFWEQYWAGCSLPSTVNYELSFDRCLAEVFKGQIAGAVGEILEIGCAPGKWLSFFSNELNLKPSGIEYTRAGMQATLQNLTLQEINYGFIKDGDFFTTCPDHEFDVVISLGFIEHFDNPDAVVDLHLKWLKPDGLLVLGVPNFKGVYKVLQTIFDSEILHKHNTAIMTKDYFTDVAGKFGLDVKYLDYIGSFEPELPIRGAGFRNPLYFMAKIFLRFCRLWRRFKYFDRINHPLISSYILAIYQKRGNA
jgi:SAM-dependent methyltransferase